MHEDLFSFNINKFIEVFLNADILKNYLSNQIKYIVHFEEPEETEEEETGEEETGEEETGEEETEE